MSFTFAIGDIHGCYDEMAQMLETIETWWPGGTIVFLGDYIDRGPASRRVVERLMAGPTKPGWSWILLKGNHEAMMVSALRGEADLYWWLGNGGDKTAAAYDGSPPDEVLDWADSLPTMHVDRHRIFVHAGIDDELPLDEQSEETLLWRRPPEDYGGDYEGKHLCHGHTPLSFEPTTIGNRTNIDTGCVFGGFLTAALFDDDVPGAPLKFVRMASKASSG